jgi:transcriptional regulator with XRE-family HTH domain
VASADQIWAVTSRSPAEIALDLAGRVRARRLEANLAQEGLAARAGVSLGSLKRFERTGEISLERLIRIALALDASEGFAQIFAPKEPRTLDEILATPPAHRRGRRR